jgi:dephospho-CoA kinase
MKVVGLTGGIATGKSTVARILGEDFGGPILDADQVARELVAPGTPALAAIAERFGPAVLRADGTLDRGRLRARIASDPEARRALEAITHPRIRASILEQLAIVRESGAPAAVVEAALMVETGSYRAWDALIVVSCDPAVQLARLVARDATNEAEARALIATQLPMADKERVATVVVRNDAGIAALRQEVERAWAVVGPRSR